MDLGSREDPVLGSKVRSRYLKHYKATSWLNFNFVIRDSMCCPHEYVPQLPLRPGQDGEVQAEERGGRHPRQLFPVHSCPS